MTVLEKQGAFYWGGRLTQPITKTLTWAQVKQKAKAENKFIFADCDTTWCAPCKVLAKEVFTQPEVSSFLMISLSM